jgi:uncharacterized protein (DUF58 family)
MREERMFAPATLQVYPLVAPVEAFGLSPRQPFGDRATRRCLFEDPLRMVGVRDYEIGDDPRRIHWKATARAGELRSKVYEASSQHNLLLFLDINTYKESWMGIDPFLQEFTIAAAASLCNWALEENYAVGLAANSALMNVAGTAPDRPGAANALMASRPFSNRVNVPFARDNGQLERILSTLARLIPYFGSSMAELIDSQYAAASAGTTVLLVCAAAVLSAGTIDALLALRTRGAEVHLALTGDAIDKVPVETYDLPLHYLGGKEKWHELIASTSASGEQSRQPHAASILLD